MGGAKAKEKKEGARVDQDDLDWKSVPSVF